MTFDFHPLNSPPRETTATQRNVRRRVASRGFLLCVRAHVCMCVYIPTHVTVHSVKRNEWKQSPFHLPSPKVQSRSLSPNPVKYFCHLRGDWCQNVFSYFSYTNHQGSTFMFFFDRQVDPKSFPQVNFYFCLCKLLNLLAATSARSVLHMCSCHQRWGESETAHSLGTFIISSRKINHVFTSFKWENRLHWAQPIMWTWRLLYFNITPTAPLNTQL